MKSRILHVNIASIFEAFFNKKVHYAFQKCDLSGWHSTLVDRPFLDVVEIIEPKRFEAIDVVIVTPAARQGKGARHWNKSKNL